MSSRKTERIQDQATTRQVLQWGRDDVVAEDRTQVDGGYLDSLALQWGRDDVVAEDGIGAIGLSQPLTLQWGRDDVVAEDKVEWSTTPATTTLQWGRDDVVAEDMRRMIPVRPDN